MDSSPIASDSSGRSLSGRNSARPWVVRFPKKTFWFVSYDGKRQRNATSISTSLPVLPQVRDAAGLGAAFGLPASAIDPVAVKLLNLPGPFGGWLVPSGTLAP